MTGYLANTDFNWYRFLRDRPEVDEVNFWRPHGGEGQMRQISPGEPLIFKLKKKYDHAIVGFGRFMMDRRIPVAEAWEVFGPGNGVWSEFELWERIRKYVGRGGTTDGGSTRGGARPHHHIRCLLLTGTVFFPEELWVRGAADWSQNIVAGKYYDLDRGEGARIWRDCLRAAELSGLQLLSTGRLEFPLTESEIKNRYGGERTIRPRLGQGTFRYAVRDAYGKCAVSTEHSLPALEAAHIIPCCVFQSHGGRHEIRNGLLLRADIHKLFDAGYVTVTPDHRFRVSERLADEYHNGRSYYRYNGSPIWVPPDEAWHPDPDALAFHGEEVFVG